MRGAAQVALLRGYISAISRLYLGYISAQAALLRGERLPSSQEVQAALANEVPAAYVPAEWHFRDALPLGSAGKVDHKLVLSWIKDQSKASMWGAIYDELYFANEFQVSDGVDDPTMDWAAYTDSFTNEMHERPTIQEWVDETVPNLAWATPDEYPTPIEPPVGDPADFNGDGKVNGADLGILISGWGSSDPVLDLDGSGEVDGGDFGVLLASWKP